MIYHWKPAQVTVAPGNSEGAAKISVLEIKLCRYAALVTCQAHLAVRERELLVYASSTNHSVGHFVT